MENVTIVTAFFDIGREVNGDGRKISEYLEWIKNTLKLNCNLYFFTEKKFVNFIKDNRTSNYNTFIKEDTLENSKYYKYLDSIKKAMHSCEYKNKMTNINRVECRLPEYNIIQYSKFGWLEEAIKENPFNTEYFFWMDAGISRFFGNINLQNPFPSKNDFLKIFTKENTHKFIIQHREDLYNYTIDEDYMWKSDNLFKGGMFGGHRNIVKTVSNNMEQIFVYNMLHKNNVNNEQICFAFLWKKKPELFKLIPDINRHPCILLELLSQ